MGDLPITEGPPGKTMPSAQPQTETWPPNICFPQNVFNRTNLSCTMVAQQMNCGMLIISRYDADRGAIMWREQSLYQENQLSKPRPSLHLIIGEPKHIFVTFYFVANSISCMRGCPQPFIWHLNVVTLSIY